MPKSRFIRIKCWQEWNISAVNKVHCNPIVKSIKSLKIDCILQGNGKFKGNKKSLVATENVSPTQLTVTDLDPHFSHVPTKKRLWVSYLSSCVFSHVHCHTAFPASPQASYKYKICPGFFFFISSSSRPQTDRLLSLLSTLANRHSSIEEQCAEIIISIYLTCQHVTKFRWGACHLN